MDLTDQLRDAIETSGAMVRQRTQIINALRGHLAEFGLIVAQGPAHVAPTAPRS